ncbi:MAG: hypothetical protein K2W92_01905 [Alphaproteobacteria bacterium]|nr:hypothetical protein [Alphaproteobacteria bacterium]
MKDIQALNRHLDLVEDIYHNPASQAKTLTFMARPFVQATLPHRDPGNINVWQRRNGRLTLKLQAGFEEDPRSGDPKCIGFPFGTIPRLLLFWMTAEVIRSNNKIIEFNGSLSSFLNDVGIGSLTGGKNGSILRFKDQLKRLLFSTFTIDEKVQNADGSHGINFMNIGVASRGYIEWIPGWQTKIDNQRESVRNKEIYWIELTENFFKTLTNSVVPLDMRIIQEIKQSPLALDLYAWLVHRTYENTEKQISKSESFVSWRLLHDQFGSSYNDMKNFKKKVKPILKQILSLTRNMSIEEVNGGIKIKPKLRVLNSI